MKVIKFARDFPKLENIFFTTIRTPPKVMRTGTVCKIETPTRAFKAILVMKRKDLLSEFETDLLTEDTATDSREGALAVLREFYPGLDEQSEVQVLWFVHDRRD